MGHIFIRGIEYSKNPSISNSYYVKDNKDLGVTIENMSAQVMEDLAIHAFIGVASREKCNTPEAYEAYEIRRKLIEELEKIATDHI